MARTLSPSAIQGYVDSGNHSNDILNPKFQGYYVNGTATTAYNTDLGFNLILLVALLRTKIYLPRTQLFQRTREKMKRPGEFYDVIVTYRTLFRMQFVLPGN